jgi:hypothetical protein
MKERYFVQIDKWPGSPCYLIRRTRDGRPVWGRSLKGAMKFWSHREACEVAFTLYKQPAYRTVSVGTA